VFTKNVPAGTLCRFSSDETLIYQQESGDPGNSLWELRLSENAEMSAA
jgi:hypothetical protein